MGSPQADLEVRIHIQMIKEMLPVEMSREVQIAG